MKRFCLIFLLFLSCFLLMPFDVTYAKGRQKPVPDTVADPHSKYTALYKTTRGAYCTAILISSTAALTARHCSGPQPLKKAGTIYPGANGDKTPFGYMNISNYIPNPKYDIAILKGTERDQDKFYRYYIRPFTTTVRGYTDAEFQSFVGSDIYSYGYPQKDVVYKKLQYRSDGNITSHEPARSYLRTDMPTFSGQSGSGVFKKDGQFLGIIVTRTQDHKANVLDFNEDLAKWINDNAK
ncbi:trypsin-like peptidase domain-containing protein [Staphylococcus ursi]|uniref:trypsin-like serine peptidase n=1 Tax=Staphylococcus sp. MI 10-1553 TaxID=1912064 RepID=UPI00139862A3|nr:serine protease [Staphylococcus sp. MI 10-1553]QHW37983.1 trypsin-like peptidase domain-containing protein [Staphylococcus sp. MI 10-1553]